MTPRDDGAGATANTTGDDVIDVVRGDVDELPPNEGIDVSEEVTEVDAPTESLATPDWFKTAVFYEVLVRSFRDANGDGTGDFRGLTEKLDYLQWLGIDCLWVPPFFTSPLRDGGYDVADYTDILPEIGTVEDFHTFLDEAHQRGIRVIIDFVMNHTSDAHPWFQASRADPDGPYGDFYVWSDTDELYQDARVIFVDTEPSNWTWDPVRQQYFWHRFFSHQPDLNFDNPKVHEAMLEAMSFWLDMGLDGFRLDAVPYLYERPGTNGENLPETHEFLRMVRKFVDTKYPGRVLLAEANQWPSDVVDYFGDFAAGGDECHMCFHFPVMPRIFMAVRRESRWPISEIMEQTPAIPGSCQWGIFLRNHDELTLEMVTDEDRDYMWSEYAKDPRMKANIGIRRRLAPLLDNDTNQIELFTALLLSLPGSPVLYYGDEIGMGDNIWLGDRDGVRTPMQWTPDRNAGFSVGHPRQAAPAGDPGPGLRLPERQRRVPARERLVAAALDPPDDPRPPRPPGVRARLLHRPRWHQRHCLVVRPRARAQRRWARHRRDRLRQQPVAVPAAGRAGPATVRGHGADRAARRRHVPADRRAAVPAHPGWLRLLLVPAGPPRRGGDPHHDRSLRIARPQRRPRQAFIETARWFGGKGRPFERHRRPSAGLGRDRHAEPTAVDRDRHRQLRRRPRRTEHRVYQLPLAYYAEREDRLDHAFVGWWEEPELGGYAHVYDAVHDRDAMAGWLRCVRRGRADGGLEWHRVPGHELDTEAHSTLFSGEQSNSSMAFGDDSLLKVFRKVTPGVNPDIAVHQVLTEAGSDHVAHLYGWLEVRPPTARRRAAPAGHAPAVPADRHRRLGRRARERPQPLRRGRPARRRGGRRLRRARPPGSGSRWPRCTTRWPRTSRPASAPLTSRPSWPPRWRPGSTPRSTSSRSWRRTPTACAPPSPPSPTSRP